MSISQLGKFEIRLRRNRKYWLRPPLRDEEFPLGALERMVHPGAVVYDLGANIGLYSRFLVQKFKASKVYAFEPMSENRPQLMRNLEIGGCASQVVVMPFAVGDEDGAVDFQVDDLTSNSGTLNAVTHGEACQSRHQYGLPPISETVQVTRLDTVIATQNLLLPDVIKIDVEGAEAMALRGGRRLLLEHRPGLVVELHGSEAAVEVLQVLWDCNYYCFGYLRAGEREERVYKKITASDLPIIARDDYALCFLAASAREEELTVHISDPDWI